MVKEALKVGMVFMSAEDKIFEYGLLGVYEDFVVIEAITSQPSKRVKMTLYSYEEFLKTFTIYIRNMTREEKEKYLAIDPDPIKTMEPGIYYSTMNVFSFLERKFVLSSEETIQIVNVEIEKIEYVESLWEMEIKFLKFRDMDEHTLSYNGSTQLELIEIFSGMFKRMHTEQTWSMMV